MKQVNQHFYAWSQYQPDRKLDFNGHYFQPEPGAPGVLIDPVPFLPGDEEHVRELGGTTAVLLTNGDHVRAAAACQRTFGCPVLVPQADLAPADLPGAEPFAAGDKLPGDLTAVPVPDNKSPGETAFFHSPTRTLVVGDAVIGRPPGQLGLLAPRAYANEDYAPVARGLRALLARPVRQLLVGDGQSILRDPAVAIQDLIHKYDPAAFLLRREELVWQEPRSDGTRFGARFAEYSRLLGLKVIDFDLMEIPPGRQNCPMHRHDSEEELFIILEGQGELETENGTFPFRAGDVLAFPPRYQIAHGIHNTGDTELRLLAFAAPAETIEMVDYPHSRKRLELTKYGKRRMFFLPERTGVPYFEGERID